MRFRHFRQEKNIRNPIKHQTFGAYRFGSSRRLTGETLSLLVSAFEENEPGPVGSLEGRRSVSRLAIPQLGAVVVKHYRRGGLLARLNPTHYLRTGKTRCRLEYEQMVRAARAGVNLPEPVAFASKGGLLYRAWLVTKEIPRQQTLARLSIRQPGRLAMVADDLRRQVAKLVACGLWHVDLHPGNVLVDDDGRVFIVDFDKTRMFRGKSSRLRVKYRNRWRRAVQKHGLPEELMGFLM